MERIIPSISLLEHSTAVANFQETMLFIVEKRRLSPGGAQLAQWRERLAQDMTTQTFEGMNKPEIDHLPRGT